MEKSENKKPLKCVDGEGTESNGAAKLCAWEPSNDPAFILPEVTAAGIAALHRERRAEAIRERARAEAALMHTVLKHVRNAALGGEPGTTQCIDIRAEHNDYILHYRFGIVRLEGTVCETVINELRRRGFEVDPYFSGLLDNDPVGFVVKIEIPALDVESEVP